MTRNNAFPLFSLIREMEEFLVTDSMLARMHNEKNLKDKVNVIQKLLDISRRYSTLGFDRKGCFAYLRAFVLFSDILES